MTKPLSPEIAAELNKLRDIRLPDPISWWPLAPGWWAVLSLLVGLIIAIAIVRYFRRRTVRYVALNELDALRKGAAQSNTVELATALSVLLHRIAIRLRGQSIGVLSGEQWSTYLSNGKNGMKPTLSRFLAEAPYAASAPEGGPSATELLNASEKWIRRHA